MIILSQPVFPGGRGAHRHAAASPKRNCFFCCGSLSFFRGAPLSAQTTAAAMSHEDVDSRFMAKCQMHGTTIMEIQAERERQKAGAPPMPSLLQQIVTDQHLAKDYGAIEQRMRAAAVMRADPKSRQKKPTTEIEKLVAAAPKSSAQVIGYHDVPTLVPPPPPPKPKNELASMRSYYPVTEGHEYGFHMNFAADDSKQVREADALLASLRPEQVKADPQLANALRKIQGRAVQMGRNFGGNGQPKGLTFKQR